MNSDKSRVIITVMRADGGGHAWTARYNPGGTSPNLQAEGQSRDGKGAAFKAAFAEARRFVLEDDDNKEQP